MRLIAAGHSHPGRHRPVNQDSFLVANKFGLYAVADGVESQPAGEVASKLAVETLALTIKAMDLDADATPPFEYAEGIPLPARAMKFAFREANRKVHDHANENERTRGMATTLTAAWFRDRRVFIGNAGDSRVYLIRSGRIHQLSHDHTILAQASSDQPVLPDDMEDWSSAAMSEHELTRALGVNPDIEVQLAGGTPRPNDIFLLCTDGLYGEIRDFEIMETVKDTPPDLAAKNLITLANQRGGKDNTAVVVVQVVQ